MPDFTEIEETFCGRTDGRTFETHFIRSTQKSRPNKLNETFNGLGSDSNAFSHVRQGLPRDRFQ